MGHALTLRSDEMMIVQPRLFRHSVLASMLMLALGAHAQSAPTWNWTMLSNPDWEIMLTDAGYSDYLFDRTPGFNGREYLSGEWGAAVGYTTANGTASPKWLEPNFSYPDFATNSTFSTVTPTSAPINNAQSLPGANSVIGNSDLQITQHYQLIDTVTGVAMGLTPSDASGAGSSILSNRYALQQTYTFTNVTGQAINNVQLFQFLHGLESQSGVYDNRAYGGAYADYHYDVTLQGVSYANAPAGSAASSGSEISAAVAQPPQQVMLRDYIGFHSKVAPTAFEIGTFGNPATDSHASGEPSTGTHIAVENNALNGSTSHDGTVNGDWIAGAQRFDLGPIAAGQSVNFDVMLTILTGWGIDSSSGTGVIGGTGNSVGSVAYSFAPGALQGSAPQFFVSYDAEDLAEINDLIESDKIGALTFNIPGQQLQVFDVTLDGATFSGLLQLTFNIDLALLPAGFDTSRLHVYHWTNGTWEDLGGVVTGDKITVLTSSLSPFAIGAAPVPEPESSALALAGLGLVGMYLRRRTLTTA
jgi:hypothetical protein